MRSRARITGIAAAGAAAIAAVGRMRRRDRVHAPGKRHRQPPPQHDGGTHAPDSKPGHDQPWVRRSHSDSQQRRFRR